MASSESILGIDFGASKIVTAFYDPTTKKCDIVLDNEENRHTACFVGFTDNERLFSKTAKNQAHNNPENTLFGRGKCLIFLFFTFKRKSALFATYCFRYQTDDWKCYRL